MEEFPAHEEGVTIQRTLQSHSQTPKILQDFNHSRGKSPTDDAKSHEQRCWEPFRGPLQAEPCTWCIIQCQVREKQCPAEC